MREKKNIALKLVQRSQDRSALVWSIPGDPPPLPLRQGMVFGIAALNRVYNFFYIVCPKRFLHKRG